MDPFIGQIQPFGFNFAPAGWARCDGQLLAISTNTALFSLLGTIYGGDGRTTFAIPDLRGRSIRHQGSGPGINPLTIGQRGGSNSVTLNTTNMPSHNHGVAVAVSTAAGEEAAPNGNVVANHAGAFNEDATSGQNLGGVSQSNVGGNVPFNIDNPYLTVNVCIALFGIFPSRN
ncbi:MAG TPA: tail fiber protein [Flavobacteriaceae bacterium]|nr:tail fiber protein [Flavobacteriaceae bacterium]HQU66475.1 tail fiber protein [Flavobacteriaceae bacterium]